MAALCLSRSTFLAAPAQLSLKKAGAKAAVSVSVRPCAALRVVAMSTPDLKEEIVKKIAEAQETCADPNSTAECAVAWDEVEEISAAASDKAKKDAAADPLEQFCDENPEADECRVYSD